MRLLLHIGTHKTGTTSIQRFAHAHRDELARRGFWYPSFKLVGAEDHYSHLDLAHVLATGKSERLTREQAEAFARTVRERGAAYDAVLLSAEAFYRHRLRAPASVKPNYWKERAAFVQRVADTLGVENTSVVVTLRRQDHFAQSLYNENIRASRYTRSFEKFTRRSSAMFAYARQVELWAGAFPRPQVLVFEDLVRHDGGLVGEFFARLGAPVQGLAPVEVQNESPRPELLMYLRRLNASQLSSTQLKAVDKLLSDPAFQASERLAPPQRAWMSEPEFAEFLGRFSEDNAQVCAKYFPGRSSLFPDYPLPSGEVLQDLSLDEFTQITGSLLNWLVS